jgi:hypothetical protein
MHSPLSSDESTPKIAQTNQWLNSLREASASAKESSIRTAEVTIAKTRHKISLPLVLLAASGDLSFSALILAEIGSRWKAMRARAVMAPSVVCTWRVHVGEELLMFANILKQLIIAKDPVNQNF